MFISKPVINVVGCSTQDCLHDAQPSDAAVDIKSSWKLLQPSHRVADVQTDTLLTCDLSTQAVVKEDQQSQTAEAATKKVSVDNKSLLNFLLRAEPLVQQELSLTSRYLDIFSTVSAKSSGPRADLKGGSAECRLLLKAFERQTATNTDLVPTSLSWSSTGQSIAVAYGRYDIVGWCTTPGALTTWHVGREDVNPTKPDIKISTSSCLMCCAYHPHHPALIAGGSFNGDLFVWDLSREADMEVGRSDTSSPVLHLEPITAIQWQYSSTEASKHSNKVNAYRIVTMGADGRVLVWLWHKAQVPVYGFELLFPAPGQEQRILWGATCMAFERSIRSDQNATFVAGTEGGRLFKCSLDFNDLQAKEFQQKVAGGAADRVELRCPIRDMHFEQHAGPVQGADCSPFQRELFLTAGADGMAHLHNLLKPQALLSVEPSSKSLHAVQWSPARPLVFAVAAGDGRAYIYDLARRNPIPCPVMALDACSKGSPVYAVAFNQKEPNLVATGSRDGVKVWRLPAHLCEAVRGESALLKKLAAAEAWDEVVAE